MKLSSKVSEILNILKRTFKISLNEFLAYKVAMETWDPFETLVATILTQNTSERNAFRAYFNLKKHYPILKPEILSKASISELSKLISVGGLGNVKAKRIIEASRYVLEKLNGDLWKLLKLGIKARDKLIKIPGVGFKTADILLLMIAKEPTIPVDTHIMRVAYRLGISERKGYETVRRALMCNLRRSEYLEAHLYFIMLGRRYCLARKPKCSKCPVRHLCAKKIK